MAQLGHLRHADAPLLEPGHLPENLLRRAIQPNLPFVQHNNAVGEARDALQFLRGHHDGDLVPVGQLGQHVEHGRFAGGIQAGGRLVEHQHLRPHRQHRRDGDALLLAAR